MSDKIRTCSKIIKFIFCKILYRVKVINEEVLDKYESYLICSNHSCIFDPIFVFPLRYEYDISIVAKKELFKHKWFKFLTDRYKVFPIDRENVDVKSMLHTINVFKTDKKAKLIIFPEGKVVKNEEDVRKVYKKGASFVAYHLNKPIIPVYITRRPHLFSKVIVKFGEPFFINEEECKGKNRFDKISLDIINKIYDLK